MNTFNRSARLWLGYDRQAFPHYQGSGRPSASEQPHRVQPLYNGTLRACRLTYHITLITREDFFLDD